MERKKMIKYTFMAAMLLLTFSNIAVAKDKLNVIMAGSASGSYNSFNNEVVKDLANHYDLNIIAGQSESKGVRMFENFTLLQYWYWRKKEQIFEFELHWKNYILSNELFQIHTNSFNINIIK